MICAALVHIDSRRSSTAAANFPALIEGGADCCGLPFRDDEHPDSSASAEPALGIAPDDTLPAHGVSLAEATRVWLRVALLSFGGPGGPDCCHASHSRAGTALDFRGALLSRCHRHGAPLSEAVTVKK